MTTEFGGGPRFPTRQTQPVRHGSHLEETVRFASLRRAMQRAPDAVNRATQTALLAAGYTAAAALVGAAAGEVLDHTPYLRHAIPEGVQLLAAYWNPEAMRSSYLVRNMDKVGATIGAALGVITAIRTRHNVHEHASHHGYGHDAHHGSHGHH
jgi:hypothetical protein